MNLSEFDYHLPEELIAQNPSQKRDHSRLLVYRERSDEINHCNFYQIVEFFKEGDLLVINNSRVFKARLLGKKGTGAKVEILLNHEKKDGIWEALGKNVKSGDEIGFDNSSLLIKVLKKEGKFVDVALSINGVKLYEELEKIGHTPLPPYIKHEDTVADENRYQTVYSKYTGSVAAPTAGLHFSEDLLAKIKEKGVKISELTLHVGIGTFSPIETEEIENHKMHEEYFSVSRETVQEIIRAKKEKRRVIAVGTTTTRVLEHIFSKYKVEDLTKIGNVSGSTNIFICPGYQFRAIDGLITNFHLPKSSLLILVSSFIGREKALAIYEMAVDKKYKFFSYGDAMLLLK